jgi:hypothetical protein
MRRDIIKLLRKLGACKPALNWVRSLPVDVTMYRAWMLCKDYCWLDWFVYEINEDPCGPALDRGLDRLGFEAEMSAAKTYFGHPFSPGNESAHLSAAKKYRSVVPWRKVRNEIKRLEKQS